MPSSRRLLLAFGIFVLSAIALLGIAGFSSTHAAAPSARSPQVSATCIPYWFATVSQNVGANDNVLAGVAVLSPAEIWAVGFYTDTNGVGQAMIQRSDGNTWSLVTTPQPGAGGNYLQAVTARAPDDIWAVGFYRATTGSVPQTLVLHYNGSTWSHVASPNPGVAENYLYGVAFVSATDAWAVGYYADTANIYRTLTLRWNGSVWTQVPSPTPPFGAAGLRGVVVVSPTEVWAVGAQADLTLTFRMYALRWNGSTWSATTTPSTGGCVLTAVSRAAPGELWAVGGCQATTYQTAIIRWNGSTWATVPSPNPGTGDNLLAGVAASPTGAEAYAVGGYNDTGGPTRNLTLYWNGTTWSLIPGDNPGTTGNALLAISHHPTLSSQVWAVGSQESGGPQQTLAERYGFLCETATPTIGTGTATPTATNTPVLAATSTATAMATSTQQGATATHTTTSIVPTGTATGTPGGATSTPSATPTPCVIQFADVLPDNTFYSFVRCLGCRAIISGYDCGGPGEPCNPDNDPYFRPGNNVTRGQIAQIVSNAAGFNEPANGQTFEDVLPGSTFYDFVERLTAREIMSGYTCGGLGEPCVPPGNRPYFRPNSNATRGQLAKIVSNAAGLQDPVSGQTFEDVLPGSTFYEFIERLVAEGVMSGYACGGPAEPCVPPGNRPYFRPASLVTRGQTSKIVANTFFPDCYTP
ncbi:MAG: S-layer homology domain-containing protein [Chloroflexia bacterium]